MRDRQIWVDCVPPHNIAYLLSARFLSFLSYIFRVMNSRSIADGLLLNTYYVK